MTTARRLAIARSLWGFFGEPAIILTQPSPKPLPGRNRIAAYFTSITYTSCPPSRLEMKAMRLPSGDHVA